MAASDVDEVETWLRERGKDRLGDSNMPKTRFDVCQALARQWHDEHEGGTKAKKTPPTIGWMVSEIYAMVKRMAEAQPQRKLTVGEQAQIGNEPLLGLASTEDLFHELISRCRRLPISSFDQAIALAEMLGSMSAPEREYRTIDG